MEKLELIDAIEKFLMEKEPITFSKTKKDDIKRWVNDNYDVVDGKLTKKNVKSNTLSFFYF